MLDAWPVHNLISYGILLESKHPRRAAIPDESGAPQRLSLCCPTGFSDAFYRSYHEVLPRAAGFEERKKLYLLYHYLNHYNLFGSSYYQQCASLLQALTRKL
jgi:hypothetical protein